MYGRRNSPWTLRSSRHKAFVTRHPRVSHARVLCAIRKFGVLPFLQFIDTDQMFLGAATPYPQLLDGDCILRSEMILSLQWRGIKESLLRTAKSSRLMRSKKHLRSAHTPISAAYCKRQKGVNCDRYGSLSIVSFLPTRRAVNLPV